MTSFITKLRGALIEANLRHAEALALGNAASATELTHAKEYILDMLVREIQAESNDPYTTAADIRYFEEVRAG